jgi:hypothetical protein
MNKRFFLFISSIITATVVFSSCSSSTSTPPPTTTLTATLNFPKNFHGNYDVFAVDTADKNGNNADIIIGSSKTSVTDIVLDTGLTYQNRSHVAKITTFQGSLATDSNYFYQDPNGDLYRYNFGFNLLNQFSFLTAAVGGNVDVGWVLAAKITSAQGTTWIARVDSVLIQSLGIWVYFTSQGQMMEDTTFTVGSETVKARHAKNTVTATVGGGAPSGETGMAVIDSYYSTDINAVIEDFFRHVSIKGSLSNQQAQGKFKIMTSHY